AKLQLNWKDDFGGSGLVHPVTTVQKFPNLLTPRKNHLPRWFFRLQDRRLPPTPNDLKKKQMLDLITIDN
ncbi:hypothetical protein, partial [Escherichia coli]|uniref:hypothetical protein n=1 Tax=Escherichia coli TaxID=562 RepID=UPI001F29AC9F